MADQSRKDMALAHHLAQTKLDRVIAVSEELHTRLMQLRDSLRTEFEQTCKCLDEVEKERDEARESYTDLLAKFRRIGDQIEAMTARLHEAEDEQGELRIRLAQYEAQAENATEYLLAQMLAGARERLATYEGPGRSCEEDPPEDGQLVVTRLQCNHIVVWKISRWSAAKKLSDYSDTYWWHAPGPPEDW
jgi:chromosome segregation ATPase